MSKITAKPLKNNILYTDALSNHQDKCKFRVFNILDVQDAVEFHQDHINAFCIRMGRILAKVDPGTFEKAKAEMIKMGEHYRKSFEDVLEK